MPEQPRLVALIALVLVAVGAWRLHSIVDATPMVGYANQFDMRRTSACVGLWPDVAPEERLQAHPQAPIRRYVRGAQRLDECYFSTELAFVLPTLVLGSANRPVDLRRIGATKAVLLVALALAFTALLLRHRPLWALAHGLVFAIVVCDPLNTLWLNTLYTEFAALFFLYASVVLLVVIGAREFPSDPPSLGIVVAFATSLIGLGLSREQHFLLPLALALPVVISLWRPALPTALSLAAVVVTVAFTQTLIPRHPTIREANSANVVLGAILPASSKPASTAARLDLPPRCLRLVGATYYVPMGETLSAICPEALAVPRSKQLRLLFAEPDTLFRAGLRAMPQLQDWRLGYMGAVEGDVYAGAEAVRSRVGYAAASIAPIVTAMPVSWFLIGLTASLALFAVSTIVALYSAATGRRAPLALTLYGLTCTTWYAIATAIGGDGYIEVPRHAQLAAGCLFATGVVLVTATLGSLVGGRARSSRYPFAAVAYTAAALGTAALAYPALRTAIATVPMALGVVDRPQHNVVGEGEVELAGWALDPLGVAAVEIVSGTGEVIAAKLDLPYSGLHGEPLQLYYPTYLKVAHPGFVAQVPARSLANPSLELHTIVVNSAGVRTEIDRRTLVHAAH